MDPIERLDSLSETITQTFHHEFVFLITADRIQHFPARNTTYEQKLAEIKKRLDHSLMVTTWQGHKVIYSPDLEQFALIPSE